MWQRDLQLSDWYQFRHSWPSVLLLLLEQILAISCSRYYSKKRFVLFLQTHCGRKWKDRKTVFKSQLALSLLGIKPRASYVSNMDWTTPPASRYEPRFTLLWNGNPVSSWNAQSSQSLLSYMNPSALAGWDLLEVVYGCWIWLRVATILADEFCFWWWIFFGWFVFDDDGEGL